MAGFPVFHTGMVVMMLVDDLQWKQTSYQLTYHVLARLLNKGPRKPPNYITLWLERKVYWGIKTVGLSLWEQREQQKSVQSLAVLKRQIAAGESVS